MGYFNYFVKTIIRRLTYLLINKKSLKLIFACLVGFILCMFLFQNGVFATSDITDSTYYDGYQANISDLEALQNDFITRLNGVDDSNSTKQDLLERLRYGKYTLLCYYGAIQGTSYINAQPTTRDVVSFVLMESDSISAYSAQSQNWGTNGNIYCWRCVSSEPTFQYQFEGGTLRQAYITENSVVCWYPTYLINYRCENLTNFVLNYYDNKQANDNLIEEITGVVNNQTDTLTNEINTSTQQQTNTIIDTLTDSTADTGVLNTIDSSASSNITADNNYQSSENLFLRIFEMLGDAIKENSTVETVSFTLPYVDTDVSLRSDILSSNLPGWFILFVNTFWVCLFGWNIVLMVRRIVEYFATGQVLSNEGLHKFRDLLDYYTNQINPFMM